MPRYLFIICILLSILFYSFAFTRHQLFNSNVADLGLFDQWIWLISQGLKPVSSMAKVHFLSDHAAWVLYLMAPIYKLYPTVNWLFFVQAISLCFTAIPLWLVSKQAGLNKDLCWLVCIIWWMQPVVFNVNLFDFHPEVLSMPALAYSYLMLRENKIIPWILLVIFVIGCRDGMVLIIAGIGIDQLIRKRWKYALISGVISFGWLLFITFILFPYLKRFSEGYPGATESNLSTLSAFISSPFKEIFSIDFFGGIIYLILISISFVPFWNFKSIPSLGGWIPLVALNFIAQNPSFRTLIHQYNLPIALIGVVSVVDALSVNPERKIPFRKLIWVSACWAMFAKPYFFTGPYLSRLPQIDNIKEAISYIPKSANVLTTSYIAPHLSHRKTIAYPQENFSLDEDLMLFDVLLLNPSDPGWDSTNQKQLSILEKVKSNSWECDKFGKQIELCFKQ